MFALKLRCGFLDKQKAKKYLIEKLGDITEEQALEMIAEMDGLKDDLS